MERFDVLVVGAGPGGSAVATHLAAVGRACSGRPRPVPARQAVRRRAHRTRTEARPVRRRRSSSTSSTASSSGSATGGASPGAVRVPASDPHDPAEAARPLPRGAGGSRRGGLPRRDAGRGAGARGRAAALVGGSRVRPPSSSAPTARTGPWRGRSGSETGSSTAARGECGGGGLDATAYSGTAWVELGVVAGGYGWVFPKGDHANLGVGGWKREGRGCVSTSSDWPACTASIRPSSETSRGTACPCDGSQAARGRALLGGRGRPRRPSRVTGCTRRSSPHGSLPRQCWPTAPGTTRRRSRRLWTSTRPRPGREAGRGPVPADASGRPAPRRVRRGRGAPPRGPRATRATRAGSRVHRCGRSRASRASHRLRPDAYPQWSPSNQPLVAEGSETACGFGPRTLHVTPPMLSVRQ